MTVMGDMDCYHNGVECYRNDGMTHCLLTMGSGGPCSADDMCAGCMYDGTGMTVMGDMDCYHNGVECYRNDGSSHCSLTMGGGGPCASVDSAMKPCCWAEWDGFCSYEHGSAEVCQADGADGFFGVWCADDSGGFAYGFSDGPEEETSDLGDKGCRNDADCAYAGCDAGYDHVGTYMAPYCDTISSADIDCDMNPQECQCYAWDSYTQ